MQKRTTWCDHYNKCRHQAEKRARQPYNITIWYFIPNNWFCLLDKHEQYSSVPFYKDGYLFLCNRQHIEEKSRMTVPTYILLTSTTSKHIQHWAILDPGPISYFLLTEALVVNKIMTQNRISVCKTTRRIKSTVFAPQVSNIPELPQRAQLCHFVSGLAYHSFISVVKLCNAGCNVIFT